MRLRLVLRLITTLAISSFEGHGFDVAAQQGSSKYDPSSELLLQVLFIRI